MDVYFSHLHRYMCDSWAKIGFPNHVEHISSPQTEGSLFFGCSKPQLDSKPGGVAGNQNHIA